MKKWVPSIRNLALKTLGVTEQQLLTALELNTPKRVRDFCKRQLSLEDKDLGLISQVKSKGLKSFSMRYLGIKTDESLKEFHEYQGKNKLQKIESLVDPKASINNFFTNSYVTYKRHKNRHKAAWKRSTFRVHLNEILTIVNKCIVEDKVTWKDAQNIAMRSYFAAWTSFNKDKNQSKAKFKKLNLSPTAAIAA